MDVALNVGALLGGVGRKEANRELVGVALGRKSEGSNEGALKQDGAAKDFLAVISNQTAAAKGEAIEETSAPGDLELPSSKLKFLNSAVLKIDAAEARPDEPEDKAFALVTIGEVKSTQHQLQDHNATLSVIDTPDDEEDGLQSAAPVSFAISDAKGVLREPQSRVSTIASDETNTELTRVQPETTAPLVIDGADNELGALQPRSSALIEPGDKKAKLDGGQHRAAAQIVGEGVESGSFALGSNVQTERTQKDGLAPVNQAGTGDPVKSRRPDLLRAKPVVVQEAETRSPLINQSVAIGGEPQLASPDVDKNATEDIQITDKQIQQAINQPGTGDLVKSRRSDLLSAKPVVVQEAETRSPLMSQSVVIGDRPQVASPDIDKAVTEDVRITDKLTQQSATLNDSSRAMLSRQATTYSQAPAGDTARMLIANNGDVVSSDLDLDMMVDFASGRRLPGQVASIPQALTNPTTTQAPVVGATAQIVAAIKASRRSDTIEIRLDPPELGRVKIDFTMESMDSVKAILSAERAETLDHMRRNIGELAAQLKDAGFKSMEFEFANNGEHKFTNSSAALETSDDHGGGLPALGQGEVVYLSMRSDAQLDLLA